MASAVSVLETSDLKVAIESDAEKTGTSNIFAGPCTVPLIVVDNTANAAEAEYLKVYDHVAPTYGTTEPNWVFPIAAGAVVTIPLRLPVGTVFSNGISIACAQEGGKTTDTDPTAAVKVHIFAL